MATRVHKAKVKSKIRKDGYWRGWIVASNVNGWHIDNGWHIGFAIEVKSVDELDKAMKEYAWYNCCSELGWRVVCAE